MANFTLSCIGHGTATLDQTTAIIGSLVTLRATPESGYYVANVQVNSSSYNYIKSEEDPSVIYIWGNKKDNEVQVKFKEADTNRIYVEKSNCEVSVTDLAFIDSKVEFTITPNYGYKVKPEDIKIDKSNKDYLYYNVDSNDSKKYFFYMPDTSVKIIVKPHSGVIFSPKEKSYKKGDTVQFEITNSTTLINSDIYISYSEKNNAELLQSQVNLTSKTFSYTATEAGKITFYAMSADETVDLELGKVDIYFDSIPQNYELVSLHNMGQTEYEENSCLQSVIPLAYSSNVHKGDHIDFEKYYEGNENNVETKSIYLFSNTESEYSFYENYSYDEDKIMYIRIKSDPSRKELFCSDYVKVVIPHYTKVKDIINPMYYYSYETNLSSADLNDSSIHSSSENDEYFTAEIVNGRIKLTAKKPTRKELTFTINKADGTLQKTGTITQIYYDGDFTISFD